MTTNWGIIAMLPNVKEKVCNLAAYALPLEGLAFQVCFLECFNAAFHFVNECTRCGNQADICLIEACMFTLIH